MLGVVLWSDASDKKAVIWCEDHGDLAFVNASETVLDQDDFFDAGDLVQFDMKMKDSTRRACNTRLVAEQAGAGLPKALKAREDAKPADLPDEARIIPFNPVRDVALNGIERADLSNAS